jgi:hypothetical protein
VSVTVIVPVLVIMVALALSGPAGPDPAAEIVIVSA